MNRARTRTRHLGTAAIALVLLFLCAPVLAVDVVTEGDMETAGTDNWLPGIDVAGSNTHTETATGPGRSRDLQPQGHVPGREEGWRAPGTTSRTSV